MEGSILQWPSAVLVITRSFWYSGFLLMQSGRQVSVFLLVLLAGTTLVRGTSPANQAPASGTWVMPRTPDGHPDFQGVWTNYDFTPFERLTREETQQRGPA